MSHRIKNWITATSFTIKVSHWGMNHSTGPSYREVMRWLKENCEEGWYRVDNNYTWLRVEIIDPTAATLFKLTWDTKSERK